MYSFIKKLVYQIYQIPVEVIPIFPFISNGNQPTVFFRMNESMLNEQGFLSVLNQTLVQAGFMIMQSIIHVHGKRNRISRDIYCDSKNCRCKFGCIT